MSRNTHRPRRARATPSPTRPAPTAGSPVSALLPLGALAAGFGLALPQAMAQTAAAQAPASPASAAQPAGAASATVLPQVKVKAVAEEQGKDSYQATTTRIGKGNQELRDVPQSVTVVTERLMDDRNLDTLKDALHNTAGITFQAAEGGEEDIRLRGFSLASTGDIFVDGMRDPAFYERDTFNNDRIELLRGSASMLFGRGSTGGAVNQVNKVPLLLNQNEVTGTIGTGQYMRTTADFNLKTSDDAALRLNTMVTTAHNYGNKIDKQGVAPTYRFGIGTSDEFSVGLYYLNTKNGINYGIPWLQGSLVDIDPRNYYSAASDYNASRVTYGTVVHTHRFENGGELRTAVRQGEYLRDMRAGTIRFAAANLQPNGQAVTQQNLSDATVLNRGTNNKVQDMLTRYAQSDYQGKFKWFGLNHELLSGMDVAEEKFNNYNMVLPTGVTLDKNSPRTTIGTPDNGTGWVNESLRSKVLNRTFLARSGGVYAQDLVEFAKNWKALVGLRWDYLNGNYRTPATATVAEVTRSRHDSLWSKRFGMLYQPTATQSYHLSYGTSFNTSGDTYQYDNQTENTEPESSGNIELGAKIDSEDGQFTSRFAIFRSTKYNERNRDPDSAASQALLSGKRHSAGIEIDLTGRFFKSLEVYGSYAYTPIAKIDVGAPGSTPGVGEGAGTRSSLTPKHSGTIWATYQATGNLRVGGGLNARSSQTPNRNPAGIVAPRFVTGDLMGEYKLGDATFKLNVTNVTNKLYADALYTGHYIPGAGRTVDLTLGLKF